jgi:SprT-like domain-contaning protein Spartan
MRRINKLANTNITVYHTFHDEVNYQRKHIWRCTGSCRDRKPFYGYVKRSMNRAPSKNDTWWSQHAASCSGSFEKISEPEAYTKKREAKEQSQQQKNKKIKLETSDKIIINGV